MTTFGIDVSHYQSGLDLVDAKKAGAEFVVAKATEGQNWQDSAFKDFLSQARELGLLFAAYHFVRDDSPAANQAANIMRTVPKGVPVVLDVETGSNNSRPTVYIADQIAKELRNAGWKVSALYIPHWYWQQVGVPSLSGWDVWSSKYGHNPSGSLTEVYPGDDSDRWAAYGGEKPVLLQFGSRIRIPGYSGDVDGNAFRQGRKALRETGLFKDFSRSRANKPEPGPEPQPEPVKTSRVARAKDHLVEAERLLAEAVEKGKRKWRVKDALLSVQDALDILPDK